MKINKYDRQIRLWGQNGQRLLSEAKIALLGCSPAGIEALKNLILPGVGQIDIWDHQKIAVEDLSSSFFYSEESVGSFRAEEASKNLLEMNPDVVGSFFNRKIEEVLSDGKKLKEYSLLICGDLEEQQNVLASKVCWELDIPVIFITVVGYTFHIRNQRKVHFVTSQNILAKKFYLRLHDPFPVLSQYSHQWQVSALIQNIQAEQDLSKKKELMSQINKIPYPVILMQAFESLPAELRKKTAEIKSVIAKWSHCLSDEDKDYKQNFNQASERTIDLNQSPDNYLLSTDIFDNQLTSKATKDSSLVLQFLKATRIYLEQHKHLPQPTRMPDMHTSTAQYLQFKKVYKMEHEKSIQEIKRIMEKQLEGVHLKDAEISEYIENLDALQIVEMTPYFEELQQPNNPNLEWDDPEMRNLLLSIRVFKIFVDRNQRTPSPPDFEGVLEIANAVKNQFAIGAVDERYLKELCRGSGGSSISIYSMAGAVAGQEGIKLITGCFTPVNNGFVLNGMNGVGYNVQL